VIRISRRLLALLVTAVCLASFTRAQQPVAASGQVIRYRVSLAHPAAHLLQVSIDLPPGPPRRDLQLPVWNALYQVRDFSQYVNWVRARSSSGQNLPVEQFDKTTWRVEGTSVGATVEYEVAAELPGPYGAELNTQHAFLNLAEVLMYSSEARHSPVEVSFRDLPNSWRIATALTSTSPTSFTAADYDHLVDGPIEMGMFRDAVFDQGGAHYRVVVDADPADYDLQKIVTMDRSVVAAATAWMNDRPFDHYVFLYHFPRTPGGGGMEHAYSTAIQLNARYVAGNPQYLTNVSAHEFFHLWNVKRIRPQSLEPIDYTKENYTPSLWFSEGFTSTVAPYILLRAGLLDEPHYFQEISDQITALESRPAHLTQSAEDSSLGAWLEKYTYYRIPQRSISYYDKGELLGILLDLEIREDTHGAQSLRDMFQWMNEHFAKQGRFFPDTEGIRQAAEAVSHADLGWFFSKYVAGVEEIPYERFLNTVGLSVVRVTRIAGDPEFSLVRSFEGEAFVGSVAPGSDAEHAGLVAGDTIVSLNNEPPGEEAEQHLSMLRPGDTIRVEVKSPAGSRQLTWKLGRREAVEFALRDVDNISPQQRARRAAWLAGEDQKPGDRHP
jgi:predicted metalloprotease with PDZ domain